MVETSVLLSILKERKATLIEEKEEVIGKMNRKYVLVQYRNGNSSSCHRCEKDDNCPNDGQCVKYKAIWKKYYNGMEEEFIIIDTKPKN